MCQVLRHLTVPKEAEFTFTVTSTVGQGAIADPSATKPATKPATNQEFLDFYGTRATTAPKSTLDVPAGKTAVMLMARYSNIHVAKEQFEFDHLNGHTGVWYFIDKDVAAKF